jgi:hypothetical protein
MESLGYAGKQASGMVRPSLRLNPQVKSLLETVPGDAEPGATTTSRESNGIATWWQNTSGTNYICRSWPRSSHSKPCRVRVCHPAGGSRMPPGRTLSSSCAT